MMLAPIRRALALLGLMLVAATTPAQAADPDTVLIVVSGEGRDRGKTRPGFEMDEFAQAWLIFRANGLEVEVASPRGGAVEADGYDAEEPFNARVLADADAVRMLADTRATAALRAEDYEAVYLVGGKGAMFDLPADAALRALLAQVHEGGGVVAAVCHGPAALAQVRLADGRSLVEGRALTGFTDEEEAIFGKRWAPEFPFALEAEMRERGARWSEAPLMMPHLVVDDRLITGQNPYSTTAVAEAIVRALGREPVAREPWRDERTMTLVQRLLAGDADAARAALAADLASYHVPLIGLLGYYQLQAAKDEAAVRDALAVMELAAPHMGEPQLRVGIADAHARLGDTVRAKTLLAQVLDTHPTLAEAQQLRARLGD